MNSIVAGGPGLVAVGHDWSGGAEGAAVWTSPDGLVWTRVPHDEDVSDDDRWPFVGTVMNAVAAGDSGLIAVGYDSFSYRRRQDLSPCGGVDLARRFHLEPSSA